MNDMSSGAQAHPAVEAFRRARRGQVVLVLQGGGALGAYQVGVYQALHEAHIEPDWIIGTSIGAINAAIIAGNPWARRLERLEEFWASVERPECGIEQPSKVQISPYKSGTSYLLGMVKMIF